MNGPPLDAMIRERLSWIIMDAADEQDVDGLIAEVTALVSDVQRRGPGGNAPPEPLDDATRIARVNPEKLLVAEITSPKDLAAVLAAQFGPLVARNAEIVQGARDWLAAHDGGKKPVADEDENLALADRMRIADDHCKEVDEARTRVAQPLYRAWQTVNQWFGNLTAPVEEIRGVGKRPAINTLQAMQTAFLVAKAETERKRLLAIQEAAEAEAKRKSDAAEALRREEEARVKQLQSAGVATAEAVDEVYQRTDDAVAEAESAAKQADQIAAAVALPTHRLAVSRGASSSANLVSTWEVDVDDENGGIVALCKAIGDGTVSKEFVTIDKRAIEPTIRRKQNPLRSVPGLRIYENFAARRRGA